MNARAIAKTNDRMNSYEKAFCKDVLLHLERKEHILGWAFEEHTLRLADRTTYTPDFMVLHRDHSIWFYEIKGWWRDDARVKLKATAEKFWWFRFLGVTKRPKKDGGGWAYEYIPPYHKDVPPAFADEPWHIHMFGGQDDGCPN